MLIPLEDNTANLWREAITKTYRDIITEPRERKAESERRLSVLERRSSLVRNYTGLVREEERKYRNTSIHLLGRSGYKAVKVK